MTTATSLDKPVSRVDGRQKVTGGATYAAEFDRDAATTVSAMRARRAEHRGERPHRFHRHRGGANGRPASSPFSRTAMRRGSPIGRTRASSTRRSASGCTCCRMTAVNHQGQPVALVIAETLEQAQPCGDAGARGLCARSRGHRRRTREPVDPTRQQTDQGEQRPPETAARRRRGRAREPPQVKVDQTYVIPREHHNPIELHATIAAWDGDRLTLWDKTQWVHNVADEIAAVFGIPAENVRVVSPFVGGAFGSGLRTWPHVTLAALGARVAGRPVKLMLSRREMYYGVGYRPHTVQRVALGASSDGRLAAHRARRLPGDLDLRGVFTEALAQREPVPAFVPERLHAPPPGTHERATRRPTCARPARRAASSRSNPPWTSSRWRWASIPSSCACATSRSGTSSRTCPSRAARPGSATGVAAERFGWSRRNPKPRSMRDGRWLIGWGMATATYPMNYAPASAQGASPARWHRRGDERGERHGAGHLDVDDAGGGRGARPADRAGQVHPRRHPAAQGARARRLDHHGERRQRRAGRLPQGARGRARTRRRQRSRGGHAPPRPARRGLGGREAGRREQALLHARLRRRVRGSRRRSGPRRDARAADRRRLRRRPHRQPEDDPQPVHRRHDRRHRHGADGARRGRRPQRPGRRTPTSPSTRCRSTPTRRRSWT